MQIAHVSIPADDPKRCAEVLADIMGGEAIPFPPGGPNAWMAWSGDGEIELEIVQRGDTLHFGPQEGHWAPEGAPARRLSETHVAICVERPEREIIAIAQKAGWPARHCERGGGIFSLSEVWVEGAFMIEFMDPAQAARYREAVTPQTWKKFLAMMAPS